MGSAEGRSAIRGGARHAEGGAQSEETRYAEWWSEAKDNLDGEWSAAKDNALWSASSRQPLRLTWAARSGYTEPHRPTRGYAPQHVPLEARRRPFPVSPYQQHQCSVRQQ